MLYDFSKQIAFQVLVIKLQKSSLTDPKITVFPLLKPSNFLISRLQPILILRRIFFYSHSEISIPSNRGFFVNVKFFSVNCQFTHLYSFINYNNIKAVSYHWGGGTGCSHCNYQRCVDLFAQQFYFPTMVNMPQLFNLFRP